jgi:tRNA G18 (ribose-2'-O)-methylase SpoU
MSKEKVKTQPDMSLTSAKHQEALQMGEERFRLWQRNVADRFKDMPDEDIRAELKRTAHPFAVCFENWIGDFNLATGIRNANAFNMREVFYVGNRKWDRRGAVGVHNYTPITFVETVDELKALKEQYRFVGIDNVPGSVRLGTHQWEPDTLLIFGEESVGLTPEMQSLCEVIVEIPMYGSVRSFNCGTASGIIMHDVVELYNFVQRGFL